MNLVFSSSFREFLGKSELRIAKFLINAYYTCEGDSGYEAFQEALTDRYINYLTFRTDGTISYLPAGKPHIVNDDGTWAREGRQNGRPSKVIRKLFTDLGLLMFSEKEFEEFANRYKSQSCSGSYRFDIVSNHQIPDMYCREIEHGSGTLNNSCMNGDVDYLQIYSTIQGLRMLCLFNEGGELSGRALLWTLSDGRILMDRVYVVKDHYCEMFLDYAIDNGFIRKVSYQSYDDKTKFTTDGNNPFDMHLSFQYTYDGDEFPYVDTFTYIDDTNKKIYNYANSGCTGELNNTDGTISYYNSDDDDSDEDDMRWDGVAQREIRDDDAIYLTAGTYRGEYTHTDNAACVGNSWYWADDQEICYYEGDYYLTSDCVEVDGISVPESHTRFCKVYNEFKLREDCVQLSDGTYCLTEDAHFNEATKETTFKPSVLEDTHK